MKIYLLTLYLFAVSLAYATDKDQTLMLVETTQAGVTCISDIVVAGYDNCKTADGKRGLCDGLASCVCSKADMHIEWQGTLINNFSVYFYADSPFKDNCALESSSQGKLKCRIKGDASGNYDYGVKVAGCDDFDPRIIIKQN